MEKVFHANGNEAKVGVAILISDKTDLKTKTVLMTVKKRQRRTLHNDGRINPRRRYDNCKYIGTCICTQHWST